MRLLPLLFSAILPLAVLSQPVTAQESVQPLFGDGTPDIVNPARSVNQLISRGKYKDALALADSELAANPQNLNLRFLRGIIFSDLKRTAEAKAVFEQLIREYPEVAEPYNNLAVIYAAEGNLGKAQSLLESALKNNAKSATTYRNLADIYQTQAVRMYEKALKANPKNAVVKRKLEAAKAVME